MERELLSSKHRPIMSDIRQSLMITQDQMDDLREHFNTVSVCDNVAVVVVVVVREELQCGV